MQVSAILGRPLRHSITFSIQRNNYRIKRPKQDPLGDLTDHGSTSDPGASSRGNRNSQTVKSFAPDTE